VLWDDNNISIDGSLDVSSSEDQRARFEAAGWNVMAVDGHDAEAVSAAIAAAKDSDRPTMIACRTVIGFGAPTLAGSEKTHGAPLGDAELAGAREHLEWPYAPFEIPAHVLEAWRAAGVRGQADKAAWEERLNASALKAEFESALSGDVPVAVKDAFAAFIDEALATQPKLATRKASQNVLEAIVPSFPGIVGGSADLTHSNLTITKDMVSVKPGDFAGNYIHYGIREHGMAAAMNGIALHGGFVPYGGTFMVFTDYLRPALRLSALMAQRVIYVMTHDSIGLGEDGPTHQPVEHLASLRAMPNVLTFRPADVVETAEAWQTALETTHAPSVLCLSRQGLPCLRKDAPENMVARGGYILRDVDGARDVTLMASGSEVELAVNAAAQLAAKGIKAVVVSMPCQELFDKQPVDYKKAVLGDESLPRVAIEAAATYGWERYTGFNGAIIGMTSFGASAPAGDLFAHFGITSEAVVAAAVARVQG
jgi:transketolase